jgi:PHD/YefM family antitoxin component YafN of YafNO toxin-antitoxin module
MFKETVVASEFRKKLAYFFDLVSGTEVVQILHKGGKVKVLMTQDHYLNLISRLSLYEKLGKHDAVNPLSVEELTARVLSKTKALETEEDLQDGKPQMEPARPTRSRRVGR